MNRRRSTELGTLMVALGVPADQAQIDMAGILDWRAPSPGRVVHRVRSVLLTLTPSFRSRHASFQEIEELLLVQGVTRDLFYGSYTHDSQGKLVRPCRVAGLPVGVTEARRQIDVNTVQPAVHAGHRRSDAAAAAIVAYAK